MIEVAAAGACGCSRATAKFISPGQAQPSPKPSTTPTTSGAGPAGAAGPARPRRPRACPAMTATWPPARRSASQPVADPGGHADHAAEGEGQPGEARARAPGPPPSRPGRCRGRSRRGGQGGGDAEDDQGPGRPAGRSVRRPRPFRSAPRGTRGRAASAATARETKAHRQPRVSATVGTATPASSVPSRDRGLLDPEREALPAGRHVPGQRRVAGELPERVGGGADRQQNDQHRVRAGQRRTASRRAGRQQDAGAGDHGGPYRSTRAPDGTEASALTPK